ncbi:hypothetical protein DICPUDRAFT_83666 [Dictyostelium purpureum]|uniref:SUEL-type lectin domain-containing protein n=1 Tax=Dictyostelium purpureum TaxID=5786 RepID=F1A083_DICPU|nr:uncharacterized protein DICPUDRAFT_83666 [Dictyostelium purpureum]EGC30409.1 hypothetical protein DICPUDRAFT_83666 [Dictyostelium purpureum]|eukprot:XP_003293077.1 hypothetical protein DICPUDRAFT_83666 [Dictyostelium purpureum]
MKILKTLIVYFSFLFAMVHSEYVLMENYENGSSCSGESLIKGSILTKTCFYNNNFSSVYLVSGNKVIERRYRDSNCNLYLEEVIYEPNYCNSTSGDTLKFSILDNIDFPSNIYVTVDYSGECNGQYKDTFVSFNYYNLDFCSSSNRVSSKMSCNSTSILTNSYKNLECSGSPSHTDVTPFFNYCTSYSGTYNHLEFCNL